MRTYTPKEYAQALLEALETNPKKEDAVIRNFARVLALRGERSQWRKILPLFEKLYIEKRGVRHIDVFLAKDTPSYRARVEKHAPPKSEVTVRPDASLIGGMRIFINKEILIDGSVRSRINKLFKGLGP